MILFKANHCIVRLKGMAFILDSYLTLVWQTFFIPTSKGRIKNCPWKAASFRSKCQTLIYVYVYECMIQYIIGINGLWLFKQCRQAKLSYTGKLLADVYFKYNDGPAIRENFNFGQLPIMLMVGILVF